MLAPQNCIEQVELGHHCPRVPTLQNNDSIGSTDLRTNEAKSMKIVFRMLTLVAFLAGIFFLVWLSIENRQLSAQLQRLEAEVGKMRIDDTNRVYLVEIDKPYVPPEVAPHVERVWQFRCYLPPGYDFLRHSGGGLVADKGCYFEGSSGTNWGSPQAEATHELMTVSFQRKGGRLEAFHSFGGSSGTCSWGRFFPDRMDKGLVVQKLVSSKQGPRSFDQVTILPVLKIFDSSTAGEKKVSANTVKTYSGGLFVLCPKSRELEFEQLVRGETPAGFDPNSIATVMVDE